MLDQPLLISKGLFAWLTQTPAYYYGGAREVRVSESETKKNWHCLSSFKKNDSLWYCLKESDSIVLAHTSLTRCLCSPRRMHKSISNSSNLIFLNINILIPTISYYNSYLSAFEKAEASTWKYTRIVSILPIRFFCPRHTPLPMIVPPTPGVFIGIGSLATIFRAKYVARMASYGPTTAWEVRQNWISDH